MPLPTNTTLFSLEDLAARLATHGAARDEAIERMMYGKGYNDYLIGKQGAREHTSCLDGVQYLFDRLHRPR